MLTAAGRALLARAAGGASQTTPACLASSTGVAAAAAAASLLCRWQRGLSAASSAAVGGEEQAAAAAEATSTAAAPDPQPAAEDSTPTSSPSTTAATGPRVIQPLSRVAPSASSGGRGPRQAGGGMMSRSLTGTVHVASTPNNTLLTLLSREGLVKALVTGGSVGFRNSGKGTPQAAERAAAELARRALGMGIGSVAVRFRGTGRNKQYAVSALAAAGLNVTSLEDVTPVAYNGCRLPRRRRV